MATALSWIRASSDAPLNMIDSPMVTVKPRTIVGKVSLMGATESAG
jgi:hypothetical protein